MDKIARLRQEIERRKGYISVTHFAEELLSFLDTLSEEPDKSLEEEVKNYFQGYWPGTETVEQCNTDLHFTPPAIIRLARHFAEWQYQKDREEFAKIKAKTWCEGFDAHKEQMLKDAVEGEVGKDGILTLSNGEAVDLSPSLDKIAFGLQPRQKVRIIVLKEEE